MSTINFCTSCGNKIVEGDSFCQNCGKSVLSEIKTDIQTPLSNPSPANQNYQSPSSTNQQYPRNTQKKRTILPIILIILFVFFVLVAVGGILTYRYFISQTSEITKEINPKVEKEIPKDSPKEEQKVDKTENEKSDNITPPEPKNDITTNNGKKDCGDYTYLSTRKISPDELDGVPFEDLRLMRNEIFMRHGMKFKSADLQKYFSRFNCYEPKYDDVTSMLSDIEKYNIEIIKRNERRN